MKEEKALAILLANLKGQREKRSSLLDIAEAAHELKLLYGTNDEVASKVGVSRTMIQQFDRIAALANPVKEMIKKGELGMLAVDKAYRISTLPQKTQLAVARVVADLPEKETRFIITYAKRNPDLPAEEYRKRILESKTVTKERHLILCLVDDETYDRLNAAAKRSKVSVEKIVKRYIDSGLGGSN